jgi:CDP-glycerol glycerophosphotransferase
VRRPWPSWSLLDRLPEEDWHPEAVIRVGRQSPGVTTVRVRALLGDEEWGRTAQRRLQRSHREAQTSPEDAVLFQCYRGEVATDSQRALHTELHRRGAPLDLYWGVADHAVDLPEGAKPVLIGSARWYELLANARYLSNNVDFPRWWHRRPHQTMIQTFHGYPFKSMGVSFWKEQGRNERDLQRETARLGHAWSVALVPAPFCEELYRREYRFQGEIMASGYPATTCSSVRTPSACGRGCAPSWASPSPRPWSSTRPPGGSRCRRTPGTRPCSMPWTSTSWRRSWAMTT